MVANLMRFDAYEVDLSAGQLRKRGADIAIAAQSFQVLRCLLENPGEVVGRDELRQRIWRDHVFVDFDTSLNTAVARLRQVLCDSAQKPRFIETLPRRGYRFIAPVERVPSPAKPQQSRVKLAVLPFINLGGDPAQDYFSDAVTDELITELAALAPDHLGVIARTTAMHYKGSHRDIGTIGRQIGVDYVVEGGARRDGERIAINVQLIQVADHTHLFARKYQCTPPDLFSTENCIARAIASCVPGLPQGFESVAATGGARKSDSALAAYSEYIQGRYQMIRSTAESTALAKQHFERAIALDPRFAAGYDALAEICWYSGYLGFISPRTAFSRGIVYAVRALEIDNSRAETHALLGQFHKTIEYNWAEVHREMMVALDLDPHSPVVRMRYAVSELMPHGRVDEAAAELERALELDPYSVLARFWLCVMLMMGRHYDRCIEECRRLLAIDPTAYGAYMAMSACHRYTGKYEAAIPEMRKAAEISNGAPAMLGWLGMTLAEAGRAAEAREILQQLRGRATKGYVSPSNFAWIHLGLKEIDAAFEWLDRAVDDCDQLMMPIKSYGYFDPIRGDPRFSALLRRMNLQS